MLRVSRADTPGLREHCFRVRQSVFAEELSRKGRRGFFEFLERDLYDDLPQTTHYLACSEKEPAGTLSLIRGTDPLADCFGLPLGKRWHINAPELEAGHVAQVAQSSVLHGYRHLNVAVALWATALRDASAMGIQWFFAELHLDSNAIGQNQSDRVPGNDEICCTARDTHQQSAEGHGSERSLNDGALPPIARLFFHLGGRVCGASQYQPRIKSYCTPFVWCLEELAELHMSLLDRLPNFESPEDRAV